MLADTTETVVEHSARLQPSINLHAPVTACYIHLLWYPMYYPGGMKARVSPLQYSNPHSTLAPTQDSNSCGRINQAISTSGNGEVYLKFEKKSELRNIGTV